MNKKIMLPNILLFLFIGNNICFSQFKFGLTEISTSVIDVKWGLPFVQITPIHPGLEIGVTFLENKKEKGSHSVNANIGFFYHNVMANAPYLNFDYTYQFKIKDLFGIDLAGGIGYLNAFYPGDGYKFNESSHQYEQATIHKSFYTANIGVGLSLLTLEKMQPFIKYDQKVLSNIYNQLSILKIGVRIKI